MRNKSPAIIELRQMQLKKAQPDFSNCIRDRIRHEHPERQTERRAHRAMPIAYSMEICIRNCVVAGQQLPPNLKRNVNGG